MNRDEVKRYVVGPVVTTVELVFVSKHDNTPLTVQLARSQVHATHTTLDR